MSVTTELPKEIMRVFLKLRKNPRSTMQFQFSKLGVNMILGIGFFISTGDLIELIPSQIKGKRKKVKITAMPR